MTRWIAILLIPLAGACSRDDDTRPQPEPVTLSGSLDLEIRDRLDVTLTVRGETLAATLTPSSDFGVVAAGEPLSGDGRVEAFPEAEATLYTARFSAPARAGGPCGSQPVALALSLHRSGSGEMVAGSLTPYCGAQALGTPARTPLRLSGLLPLPGG
jgi:hypothetical protein